MEYPIVEVKKVNTEMISDRFLEIQLQGDYGLIQVDSVRNYGQLIKKAQEISCEGKPIGVEFTDNDTIYKLTGWTECPTSQIISCHLNVNIIIIKNDSLISFGACFPKQIHIDNLDKVIAQFNKKEYDFRQGKTVLRPVLINLYIEDKYPISRTKEILKKIVREFDNISSVHDADYLNYNVLFEAYSILDIPPPPPPLAP